MGLVDRDMITFSLQSGSNGNAIYVEADGVKLLFDAGISGKAAQARMAEHGRDMADVDALILSHAHSDHVRCAGVYQRKFGLPIYMTKTTHRVVENAAGKLSDVRHFEAGAALSFNGVTVYTIATPHDAPCSVAFVVQCGRRRLGIFTDLGHVFSALPDLLESVDAAYLECNYDCDMLEDGAYPENLKARIKGPGGHLSNDESAELLARCGRRRPEWIAVAHLSEDNNRSELAIAALHRATGSSYPVHHASRLGVSRLLDW